VAGPVILDVMPTDARILGFGNRWYMPALHNAVCVELPSGEAVHGVSAPYFLATKLEAFDGRGKGDYLLSHDIEDIVAVIDGGTELQTELAESAHDLKDYLADRFASLLVTRACTDALPGHLSPDHAGQARVLLVTDRMQAVAAVNYEWMSPGAGAQGQSLTAKLQLKMPGENCCEFAALSIWRTITRLILKKKADMLIQSCG